MASPVDITTITVDGEPQGGEVRAGNETYELDKHQTKATVDDNYVAENPAVRFKDRFLPGNPQNDRLYRWGTQFSNWLDPKNKSVAGHLFDLGPLAGGLGLGVLGLGGGALAGTVANLLGKNKKNRTRNWAMWGGLGSGLLGALLGYSRLSKSDKLPGRQDVVPPVTGFEKSSSVMYHDPRNFILEKLQNASDISAWEKAQWAAQVRNLDHNTASRLATALRSALGFGIGAILAKFLGAGTKGTIIGGVAGLIGASVINSLFPKKPDPIILGPKPVYYR